METRNKSKKELKAEQKEAKETLINFIKDKNTIIDQFNKCNNIQEFSEPDSPLLHFEYGSTSTFEIHGHTLKPKPPKIKEWIEKEIKNSEFSSTPKLDILNLILTKFEKGEIRS